MEMRLKAEYDEEADATYIYLNECAKVDKTIRLSDEILVDVENDGKLAGIEILHAKNKMHLQKLQTMPKKNAGLVVIGKHMELLKSAFGSLKLKKPTQKAMDDIDAGYD